MIWVWYVWHVRFLSSVFIRFLLLKVSDSVSSEDEEIRLHEDQESQMRTSSDELLLPHDVPSEAGTDSQPEDITYGHSGGVEDTDTDASDTDIEDFIDQMSNENKNKRTPLYFGSPITTEDACIRVIRLANSLNLDKAKVQILLKELRAFFPPDCHLPKTTFMLFKMTDNDDCAKVCLRRAFFNQTLDLHL